MNKIKVQSRKNEEFIDITQKVKEILDGASVDSGFCVVYTPHTTAAITINENADPDVIRDFLLALRHTVPENLDYKHFEENSPAHLKSSLIGCSETLLIEGGALVLGRWQGIYFCEFDGPREREVFVKVLRG